MSLFQTSVVKKYVNGLGHTRVEQKYTEFQDYFGKPEIQEHIRSVNEEQFQVHFFRELFVKILGYDLNDKPDYNLDVEFKNINDSKKADGAIVNEGKAIGVIELKSTQTTDLDKVETQAFGYKNHHPECVYVVTSNFEKLRFYVRNAVDYIEFDLFNLTAGDFKLMWLCLEKDNLLSHVPEAMKKASVLQEEDVTKKLYADYAKFREALFNNMVKNNPETDKLSLFKKTQKLLDRFLFIFFAEDRLLVPPNSITQIIDKWEDDVAFGDEKPLYDLFKQYFRVLNQGRPQRGKRPAIFAYNGGLFKTDELLDSVKIDDDVLKEHSLNLTAYDFETDVDVNILGHIFEHSIGEIESVQAEIKGEAQDKTKSRRKKEGVFYTPKYITQYIVENTVGKLCEEKRDELGIVDEEYTKGRKNRKKSKLKELIDKLDAYREWLLQLTILDPACGSGAFLNQALDFLIKEHGKIDELRAVLLDESLMLSDITNDILENNIYGVDINEESVEIAKLSLWLRTAAKGRKLNTLSDNIKCGNSLIDDPEVAGEKAFNWKEEFPEVFKNDGFDVVIGNPPYGIFIDKNIQQYYSKNFPLTSYKTNLYILFIERMFQVFNKGVVHFIIPKSLLFNIYYKEIRKGLIKKAEINEVLTITEKVFEDAEVGSSLLLKFIIKKKPDLKNKIRLVNADKIHNFLTGMGILENNVEQDFFLNTPNCEISIVSSDSQSVLQKLYSLNPLQNYFNVKNGLNPGNIKHILISDKKETDEHKPIIWGKDISRYNVAWSGKYINYDKEIDKKISIQDVKSKDGMNKQNRIDFALRTPDLFENRKIVIRKTGDSLIGCLDENSFYFDTLVHGIYEKRQGYELEPLLGILNSKPATSFYRLLHDIKGKVFAKISLDNLTSFPIPVITIDSSIKLKSDVQLISEKTEQLYKLRLQFVDLLKGKYPIEKPTKKLQNWQELEFKEFLKELKKQKVKLSLSEESEWMQYFNEQKQKAQNLQQKIDQTDREIDQMVYELYGLTDEEIKIVEESVG